LDWNRCRPPAEMGEVSNSYARLNVSGNGVNSRILMKDDFASLYVYNRWADRKVLDACRKLTPEQYVAEPVPGWSSVGSTITHIAIVTDGWLRGVAGEAVESSPTEADLPTVGDAERLLERAYQIFSDVVPSLTPEQLATPRLFRGRGRSAMLPPWIV